MVTALGSIKTEANLRKLLLKKGNLSGYPSVKRWIWAQILTFSPPKSCAIIGSEKSHFTSEKACNFFLCMCVYKAFLEFLSCFNTMKRLSLMSSVIAFFRLLFNMMPDILYWGEKNVFCYASASCLFFCNFYNYLSLSYSPFA